jgi:hypothetical protein
MSLYRGVIFLRVMMVLLVASFASYVVYNERQKQEIKTVNLTCEILHVDPERNLISFKCLEN